MMNKIKESDIFSEEELKLIAASKKEARQGKLKSSKEVHKKAREILKKYK